MFFCQNLNSHICSSQSRLSLRLMTLIFWQTYYEFSIMMVSMPFEFKSQDAPHFCPGCLWSVQKACRASYEIRRMEFLKFVETSESSDKLLAVQILLHILFQDWGHRLSPLWLKYSSPLLIIPQTYTLLALNHSILANKKCHIFFPWKCVCQIFFVIFYQ